jgi:uncharacterized membrane protein
MFSVLPLLAGLLLVAASLTPSLVPRDWVMQGALAGVSMAAGYVATQFLLALWRTLEIPVLRGRAATIAHAVIAVPVLIVLLRCVALSSAWQDSIRSRMHIPPLDSANTTRMLVLAAGVFLSLFVLGKAVQGLFDLLRLRLARYIPATSANVLGLLLAGTFLVILTRDGVVNGAMRIADSSYVAAQHLTDPNLDPPTEPWQSGGPGSVVDWGLMGAPGRDFVLGGPRAAARTRRLP